MCFDEFGAQTAQTWKSDVAFECHGRVPGHLWKRPSSGRLGRFGPFWAVLGRSGCWVFWWLWLNFFRRLGKWGQMDALMTEVLVVFQLQVFLKYFSWNPRQWFSAFLTELETPVWNRIQTFLFYSFFAEATLAATARSWLTAGTHVVLGNHDWATSPAFLSKTQHGSRVRPRDYRSWQTLFCFLQLLALHPGENVTDQASSDPFFCGHGG